jgi:hypothetical protein
MLRFDKNELEQHADEFCGREARIANGLSDLLRSAASVAPAGAFQRVRRLIGDANDMARYFSAMKQAFYEAGEHVEETSRTVLERLEDSTAEVNRLLR